MLFLLLYATIPILTIPTPCSHLRFPSIRGVSAGGVQDFRPRRTYDFFRPLTKRVCVSDTPGRHPTGPYSLSGSACAARTVSTQPMPGPGNHLASVAAAVSCKVTPGVRREAEKTRVRGWTSENNESGPFCVSAYQGPMRSASRRVS